MTTATSALNARLVAIHESGHAVVAWHLGLPVQEISIAPDEYGLGGHTDVDEHGHPARTRALWRLAGVAAESSVVGLVCALGSATGDAADLVRLGFSPFDPGLWSDCRAILACHVAARHAIVAELLRTPTISGADLQPIRAMVTP